MWGAQARAREAGPDRILGTAEPCKEANGVAKRLLRALGHETSDVHEGYGTQGMNRTETRTVASIPLLEDLDLSIFHGLDFEGLAAVRPKRGRPRNHA